MKCFEFQEIVAVARPVGKALEAHDAAQVRDACRLTLDVKAQRALGDGVEVEGRKSATQEVDDPVATVNPQMLRFAHIVLCESLSIVKPCCANTLEKANDRFERGGVVRDEQIAVLSRSEIAVGDDAESTDHDILEPYGIGVGDDAIQVRTRRLV